ncbi:importin beta-3, putative [Entamoeba dispar SAW760]|uniref:Importin beta-3, putative n=1 Tax=Entamoeba dispar (strain ATCC PRA-260 / SAW760) TaxID=370354 RepID=B0ERU8_ENTDS|nr:importin beta-3, putative [Entamoeba dispar SAW760]EDR22743.1 importin beta-3, putative [Entamoeba dispar SAW760]|eukprot:EDR22743.1 importin beta-3, putative [Entamoeba dispar SAW760]
MSDLTTLLQNCMSPDESIRKQAESTFEQMKQQPSLLLPQLAVFANASSSNPAPLRLIALTQFNNMLVKIPKIRDVMSDQVIMELCKVLIEDCKVENEFRVVSILSSVITSFAFSIQQEELPWPNYIQTLFSLTQEQGIIQQCIALDALGKSTTHPEASLIISHVSELKSYINRCLSIDNIQLRLKAITFLSNAVGFIETTTEGKKFNELYPLIMQTLQQLIQNNEVTVANNVLDDLQELASFSNYFFAGILPTVSENLMTLCNSPIDNSLKESAMEVLLSLIQNNTSQYKKSGFLPQVLICLLNWLTSVSDDDVEDWLNENTDDTLFEYAQDALETLTSAIGGKPLRDTLFNKCVEFAKMSDWPHRFAAVTSLAQVIQHGKFIIKSNITEVLQLSFSAVSDNQPLIVYSLLNLLEGLMETFPHIMIRSHFDSIVNALILCVKSPHSRIQEKACFTLQSMLDNLGECSNKLIPFIGQIMDGLLILITTNNQPKTISTGLSSIVYISLLVTNQMGQYYEQFQKLFNALLPKCTTFNTSEMKGKMIELMAIFNSKLNPQFFSNIQEIIYNTLSELFKQPVGIEDPVLPYVMSALCRMVDSPNKAIRPNLDKFIVLLLNRIGLPIIKQEGDQTDVINVTNMISQEKKYLFFTIKKIAEYLKGEFAVYAEKTYNSVSPWLDCSNTNIKLAACIVLPLVISSLIQATGKSEQLKQIYYNLIQKLCQLLINDKASDTIEVILDCIQSIIITMGENSLEPQMISLLFETFDKTLYGTLENKGEALSVLPIDKTEDELDDEEIEMLGEEDQYDDYLQKMLNTLSSICENHLQTFFAAFNMKLFPRIMIYFGQTDNETRCSFAVSAMGTVICNGKLYHYLPHVGDQFISYMKSSSPDIAFNAILFVGRFAELEIPEFQPLTAKALNTLSEILTRPKNKTYHEIHSQLVTTLGEIILHNPNIPNKESLVKSFIGLFPVTEGFYKLVEIVYDLQTKGFITSSNDNETAEIIYRLTSFCADTIEEEECSIDTKKRIIGLLKIWTSNVSPNIIQAVWSKLTVDQRGELTDLQKEQL